ncbi:MAG: replicative DNA helicase [Candidatus Thiodiazotropha sp. (ex. Lucinisca nassula)]|nr:replicative DNA helicase [Candidatus Thiodiazotropha sp. (ex. Lucinisca nassula)]
MKPNKPRLELVSPKKAPYSEASVLGAVMYDGERLHEVAALIDDTDFHDPHNAAIWRAIVEMDSRSMPVDVLTVSEYLSSKGILDDIGGLDSLTTMIRNTPSSENVMAYARIVADKADHRTIEQVLQQQMEQIGGKITGGKLVSNIADRLHEIREKRGGEQPFLTGEERRDAFLDAFERRRNAGELIGLSTGFTELDEITNGLQPSDVMIVAGRPSMGKTSLAMNIAEHAVTTEKNVLVVSVEMNDERLTQRLVSSISGVPLDVVLAPAKYSEEQATAINPGVEWLADHDNLLISEHNNNSIEQIRALAVRAHRHVSGLDLLVIDYLQLIEGSGDNRTEEMSKISRAIKKLAKDLDIPIVLLSQLNRAVENRTDKRPVMSDLRESGQIEQDADIIAFCYRDEYYNPDTTEQGVSEIIIRKNRQGQIGTVKLAWEGECVRFRNLDRSGGWSSENEKPVKESKNESTFL